MCLTASPTTSPLILLQPLWTLLYLKQPDMLLPQGLWTWWLLSLQYSSLTIYRACFLISLSLHSNTAISMRLSLIENCKSIAPSPSSHFLFCFSPYHPSAYNKLCHLLIYILPPFTTMTFLHEKGCIWAPEIWEHGRHIYWANEWSRPASCPPHPCSGWLESLLTWGLWGWNEIRSKECRVYLPQVPTLGALLSTLQASFSLHTSCPGNKSD